MKNLIRRAYININTKKEAVKNDERGVSAIVATVLLLLIVVLMAAVFYETIAEWFSTTMSRVLGEGSDLNYDQGAFQPS